MIGFVNELVDDTREIRKNVVATIDAVHWLFGEIDRLENLVRVAMERVADMGLNFDKVQGEITKLRSIEAGNKAFMAHIAEQIRSAVASDDQDKLDALAADLDDAANQADVTKALEANVATAGAAAPATIVPGAVPSSTPNPDQAAAPSDTGVAAAMAVPSTAPSTTSPPLNGPLPGPANAATGDTSAPANAPTLAAPDATQAAIDAAQNAGNVAGNNPPTSLAPDMPTATPGVPTNPVPAGLPGSEPAPGSAPVVEAPAVVVPPSGDASGSAPVTQSSDPSAPNYAPSTSSTV